MRFIIIFLTYIMIQLVMEKLNNIYLFILIKIILIIIENTYLSTVALKSFY